MLGFIYLIAFAVAHKMSLQLLVFLVLNIAVTLLIALSEYLHFKQDLQYSAYSFA